MRITVFTPTYNRRHIIETLYRSLQRQTFRDFEWLVVDDGSIDGTEQLFDRWCREETGFPIRYVRQENGGKHRAINHGLKLAQGTLFFTVDSDDYLTDDALEKVDRWEAELPKDGCYCGFAGNLGTAPGQTPNRLLDGPYFDGTALDRYGLINGERAMVFYTDIHRRYLYPEFHGERFMTEAVVWNRMAGDGYRMRFYNDIIWIYEYQPDGLTNSGNAVFLNNPMGYGLWLREKLRFQGASSRQTLQLIYSFTCELGDRLSVSQIARCIDAPKALVALLRFIHKLR